MAKTWVLDKVLKAGVEYETPTRTAYVIKKVGTDDDASSYLVIDGKELGAIKSLVAPLHKTSSNLLGPYDLRDEYYVVPPETKFKFDGASGKKCRIIGEVWNLGVGESLPSPIMDRFKRQHQVYRRFFEGSFSLGTDVTWKANAEYTVLSLTPLTVEKVTFDDIVMVEVTGDTVSEGDFALEVYINNSPLEVDVAEGLMRGIDVKSLPRPPSDTAEMLVFSLKDMPITVEGDNTIDFRVRNVSGSDKAPASGSSWTVTVTAMAKYERTS